MYFGYGFYTEAIVSISHMDGLPVEQADTDSKEIFVDICQVGDIVGVLAARFVLAALVGLLYGLANRCVVDFLDHCLMYLPIYLL